MANDISNDFSSDFGGPVPQYTTDVVDIANRALQVMGTRTTVTLAEMQALSSNEAIQINIAMNPCRRRLLRMAPWNFAMKTANLTYITSAPGTPENTSAATTLWQPGQPSPPWAYEYQYPVDCIRPQWIIPATQTGFAGGVPITTAVTGGAAQWWRGPPVKFKVQRDTFYHAVAISPISGGLGYVVGDSITLWTPPNTSPPIGAPAKLIVNGTDPSGNGAITNVLPVPTVYGAGVVLAGSYFTKPPNPVPVGSTSGAGTGATFNIMWGGPAPQRVILTNQEFATCTYISDVWNPILMDDDFQECWAKVLGALTTIALTGDKKLANGAIQEANIMIAQARTTDGNEGLTNNDITPDWIRIRGTDFNEPYSGPYSGFDWGGLYPIFG